MKHIWSPWRMKYIMDHERSNNCVFCNASQQTNDADNLIVFRGQLAFVILNRYPYTSGHLMVVPYTHQPSIENVDAATRSEMIELTTQSMTILRSIYAPDGFNLGANIGEAAGAGVATHVHIHVVPRWAGDTNFMSAVSDIRVLPETLDDTYQRVRETWAKYF